MPRPPMLLLPQYMFVVSLFGLPYALNSSRHYLIFPLKSPRIFPLKGLIAGRMCRELTGVSLAKDTPERADDGEDAGDLIGNSCCEGCPLNGRK